MKILFIHKGFPGQFKHLVGELIRLGHKIVSISPSKVAKYSGVTHITYQVEKGNSLDAHTLIHETETKVIRGAAVAKQASKLKESGFTPDLIIGHPGWGECLFLHTIWKKVPQIHYIEYAYDSEDSDTQYEELQEDFSDWQSQAKLHMKNANVLLNLQRMTHGLMPTKYQFNTLPNWAKKKTSIIHDGIDTSWLRPNINAKIRLSDGKVLTSKDEIITFINRTYEPYRGIHVFIRSLRRVLNERPNATVLLVGKDSPIVSYGKNREDGRGWLSFLKEKYEKEIDWSRVVNLGTITHQHLRIVYQVTSAHVYLTYPFVLSWSLLEAMSCGALVICSNTSPVKEVVEHGIN